MDGAIHRSMRILSEAEQHPPPPPPVAGGDAAAGGGIPGFSVDSLVFLQVSFWMEYVTGTVQIVIGCVIALLIFTVFYLAFSCIIRILNKVMTNPKKPVDPTVRPFITTTLQIVLWLQVIPSILGEISKSIATSVAGIIGNVTLGVGIAVSPMVRDFVSGMAIAVMKPYGPGDIVSIGGVTGKVREVRALFSIIDEPDGDMIYVPNSKAFAGCMCNYSTAGKSRIDVGDFGLDHGADIDMARAVFKEAMKSIDKVMQDPAPNIIITEVTPTSIVIAARVWVLPADRPPVPFLVREAVVKAFATNNVPLASWHSGNVVATAVESLHKRGFATYNKYKLSEKGDGAGDDGDAVAPETIAAVYKA